MKFLSVCSGIDAASVAWNPLGWKAVAFSEIEPFPCAVLAHHYPDVPNWGDMKKYKEWPDVPIDLLCGGTPCQSFSVAGLRAGLADPRGNLMLTFGAIAAKYRPRWLVWENVAGVLSSEGGRDFASLLGLLSGQIIEVPGGGWSNSGIIAGIPDAYGLAYRVLDAQYVRVESHPRAVPQRRRRVFVVGYLGDWRRAAAVLFERESLSGHPAPRREARKGSAGGAARSLAIRGRDGVPQAELGDDCANALVTPNGGRGGIGVSAVLTGIEAFGGNNTSGPIDVATARSASASASASGRMDFESETFLVAGTLDANYGKLQGCCGQDANHGHSHLVPIAYSIMPMNSGKDYKARETDVAQPCMAGGPVGGNQGGDYIAHPIAFDCMASGMNGFGIGEVANPQRVGTNSSGAAHQAVAYSTKLHNTQSNQAGKVYEEYTVGLDNNSPPPALLTAMQVRRLTPLETERLMGLADGYTAIPIKGKPAKDGPRYKSHGNSWAINCPRWIGERIDRVEALTAIREAA